MQIKFEPDQEYQLAAINAIADVFVGQPRTEDIAPFVLGGTPVVPNRLDLSEDDLLRNLKDIQRRNELPEDSSFQYLPATQSHALNLSVEMETGTGKTYVYLRTSLELHARYGMRKFVIVVPSVAIREGVLHTITSLKNHFDDIFDGVPYHYAVYDSGNLSTIRQFSLSNSVEILITTIDSFTRDTNIMRQPTDHLQGEIPLEMIARCSPIVILDEPQNMESELRVASIAQLNPLFVLRYSATHRNPYNRVYRLTPYDAYRLKLVKRIEVAGLTAEGSTGEPLIILEDIGSTKRLVVAKFRVRVVDRKGATTVKSITARPGTDLGGLTRNSEYAGYVVDEISKFAGEVAFSNGKAVSFDRGLGDASDDVVEAQIRYTIEEHFRKAARLHPHGIKVLSLFFLDQVADYAGDKAFVKNAFDRIFREIAEPKPQWRDIEPATVRAAYFASRSTKQGEVLIDSTTGASALDKAAYDLIMRNKERLLSLDEPVSFIFSHSALREGWDNPNIFQICTLNHARSERRKRQEVGRGIRLSINQNGDRVCDERLNILTVVANESYEQYVSTLQEETIAEVGEGATPPAPSNARKKKAVRLNKERIASAGFLELWKRISAKTRYSIQIDSDTLLSSCSAKISEQSIPAPRVLVGRAEVAISADGDAFEAKQTVSPRAFATIAPGPVALPNPVTIVADRLSRTDPPMRVTNTTIQRIVVNSLTRDALNNIDAYCNIVVDAIRRGILSQIAQGIRYTKTGETYELSQFDQEFESWEDLLVKTPHAIYDYVEVQSQVERDFAQQLQSHHEVKVFAKLPDWFFVDTPAGRYIPDWAIVKEVRDPHGEITGEMLYLIRETKGSRDPEDLRHTEACKIACAKQHFGSTLNVDFKVVTSIAEM